MSNYTNKQKLKYVIVSIYDMGAAFSICDCGKIEYDEKTEEYHMYFYGDNYDDFYKWMAECEKYKDYALVIVCENGNITIIRDKTQTEEVEFVCPSIIAEGEEDGNDDHLADSSSTVMNHTKGKWSYWSKMSGESQCSIKCSNCHELVKTHCFMHKDQWFFEQYPYCPWCGAKMVNDEKDVGEQFKRCEEEELGIDLVTLFKALNGFYYVEYDRKRGYIPEREVGSMYDCCPKRRYKPVRDCVITYDSKYRQYKLIPYDPMSREIDITSGFNIEDYGKTWALTKEELESEDG